MPYAIIAIHKPNHDELRTKIRPDHVAYLDGKKQMILAGGAMLDDEGNPFGGMLIIDTDDRDTAHAFAAGDPYNKGGLIQDLKVVQWRKAFYNFVNCM